MWNSTAMWLAGGVFRLPTVALDALTVQNNADLALLPSWYYKTSVAGSRIARIWIIAASDDPSKTPPEKSRRAGLPMQACEKATAAKSRLWRILRSFGDEAVKKLIQLALQYKAAIVADVPNDKSIRELKQNHYSAERKVFLNFGRIRRGLRGLAEWYGVPYREERLYSTICPRCGAEMEEQPNRRVRCACGFEIHRDEVPALWAMKKAPVFSLQIIKFGRISAFMEIVAAPAGRGPSARRRLGRQARSGLAPGEAGREAATPPRPARLRRTAQPGLQPPETAGS
jgi:putative transposase